MSHLHLVRGETAEEANGRDQGHSKGKMGSYSYDLASARGEMSPGKDVGRVMSNSHAPMGQGDLDNHVGATGFSLVHGKTPVRHLKPFSIKQKVLGKMAPGSTG